MDKGTVFIRFQLPITEMNIHDHIVRVEEKAIPIISLLKLTNLYKSFGFWPIGDHLGKLI